MKKLIALLLAMTLLCACFAAAVAEEVPEGYPEIIKDADGNVIDLGGMEIEVTDWWSAADGSLPEANDAATEAQYEYRDWIQKTYNFKIIQRSDGDWAANPQNLLDFITSQGTQNRICIMRSDAVSAAMTGGLLYDLASLDCLDLTAPKWNAATVGLMTVGDAVYGVSTGKTEPREVVFFNKRLVEEAGIDPESIYDLQANNEWTWEKFEELVKQCTRDTDNDGVVDSYGMASSNDDLLRAAVSNNNGKFFDVVDGKYVCTVNSDETLEALNWGQHMVVTYGMPQPSPDSEWNWFFAAFKNGQAAFQVSQTYTVNENSDLWGMEDDFGMVAFPTGPKAEPGSYKSNANENVVVMPGFYDAERAWKIAFAYNLYTNDTPGYESDLDPEAWKPRFYNLFRDDRAVDETYAMLREPEHVSVQVSRNFGSDNDVLGQDFFWNISGGAVTVAEAVETKMPAWNAYLDAINRVGE